MFETQEYDSAVKTELKRLLLSGGLKVETTYIPSGSHAFTATTVLSYEGSPLSTDTKFVQLLFTTP